MDKPSEDQPAVNERAPTPVMEYASVPKLNPAARRSLWMGLLLFVPFIGVFAVRGAKWGRKTAEMTGTGRNVAKAGLILGWINIALWFVICVSLPSALTNARRKARQVACMSQLRQLSQVIYIYANSNKGFTPPSLDQLAGIGSPKVLTCPACDGTNKPAASKGAYGAYSYIYLVPTIRLASVRPASTCVTIYEPLTNHDGYGSAFAFLDGHVEFQSPRAQKMIAELSAGFNPPRPEKLK